MLRRIIPTAERTVTRGGNKTIDKGDAIRELENAARFRARSTLHTVAVQDGCTNIPLAAGGAQAGEPILKIDVSGHGLDRFVHPDPPGLIRSWKI
jgi:hypothetical protein